MYIHLHVNSLILRWNWTAQILRWNWTASAAPGIYRYVLQKNGVPEKHFLHTKCVNQHLLHVLHVTLHVITCNKHLHVKTSKVPMPTKIPQIRHIHTTGRLLVFAIDSWFHHSPLACFSESFFTLLVRGDKSFQWKCIKNSQFAKIVAEKWFLLIFWKMNMPKKAVWNIFDFLFVNTNGWKSVQIHNCF